LASLLSRLANTLKTIYRDLSNCRISLNGWGVGDERAIDRPAHEPGVTDNQKRDWSVYMLAYRVRITFLSVLPTLVLGILSVII
jgi:hypothetical protein